jgi:hypothetical protein
MFDIISFSCVALLDKAIDGEFHTLIITPRVNGKDLLPSGEFAFDARNVLVQGTDSGLFHPFNCGCGTPECAGFWKKVKLESADGAVVWKFPDHMYSECLDSDLFVGRDSMCLKFEASQYQNALDELRNSIVEMEWSHGIVNYYCGPVFSLDELKTPAGQRMIDDRESVLESIKQKAERAKFYGDLFGCYVRLNFSNGAELAMRVEDLIQAVALKAAKVKSIDPRATLVELVRVLRAAPSTVVEIAKALTWDETWQLSWINESGDVSENDMNDFTRIVEPLYGSATHTLDFAN